MVAALVPDLLFGSRVKAMLEEAGHEVALVRDVPGDADALVVDLTTPDADVEAIGRAAIPTLGFFAHVEPEVRERALAAGFDVVVPRSRFNREGPELVARLVAGDDPRTRGE
jgi:hypothetical protein